MKKLIVFALAAVLSLGVFTACTRPDTGDEPTTTATTTQSATTTKATTTASTAATTAAPTLPDDTLDSTGPSVEGKLPKMPPFPRMR